MINRNRVESSQKLAAIYHAVYAHEGFDQAARSLFNLVKRLVNMVPDKPRALYLDIDEHRNEMGGFDVEMFSLQRHFVLVCLMPYLTSASMPLARGVKNKKPQRNDLPKTLELLLAEGSQREADIDKEGPADD